MGPLRIAARDTRLSCHLLQRCPGKSLRICGNISAMEVDKEESPDIESPQVVDMYKAASEIVNGTRFADSCDRYLYVVNITRLIALFFPSSPVFLSFVNIELYPNCSRPDATAPSPEAWSQCR